MLLINDPCKWLITINTGLHFICQRYYILHFFTRGKQWWTCNNLIYPPWRWIFYSLCLAKYFNIPICLSDQPFIHYTCLLKWREKYHYHNSLDLFFSINIGYVRVIYWIVIGLEIYASCNNRISRVKGAWWTYIPPCLGGSLWIAC